MKYELHKKSKTHSNGDGYITKEGHTMSQFDIVKELNKVVKTSYHFDCWDRDGNMKTITIQALNEENATIIFKTKHGNMSFDAPY